MTDLHKIGDLVTAGLPDGTWISGRVFSREDGRRLGPRFGGPYPGWVYEITPKGDLLKRVRVPEEAIETLDGIRKKALAASEHGEADGG